MKIAVLGAGSIGTLIAGKLANSKLAEVLVHARGEHAAKLALDGIYITGHQELKISPDDYEISIADVMTNDIFDGAADYVLISSKANQVENLFEIAKRMCHLDTKVMVISNGLGHIEKCKDTFGPHRTIAATTTHGAWRPSAGVVHWAGKGQTVLGSLPGGPGETEAKPLLDALLSAGLEPAWSSDGLATIWKKVLLNIAINPLAALAGVENGALLEPDLFSSAFSTMLEGAAVARIERVNIPDDAELEILLRHVLTATSSNICSMLQDIRAGRNTEIAVLNQAITLRGERAGIATPLNQMLTSMVKALHPR